MKRVQTPTYRERKTLILWFQVVLTRKERRVNEESFIIQEEFETAKIAQWLGSLVLKSSVHLSWSLVSTVYGLLNEESLSPTARH